MDGIMSPSISYVEALTFNVTEFGDRPFKEVIELKKGHMGRTSLQ